MNFVYQYVNQNEMSNSRFTYLCRVFFLIKAKCVTNIPQNVTEHVEGLQTYRHSLLKI